MLSSNTLAYFGLSSSTKKKKIYNLALLIPGMEMVVDAKGSRVVVVGNKAENISALVRQVIASISLNTFIYTISLNSLVI
jgi:hypothetical protein